MKQKKKDAQRSNRLKQHLTKDQQLPVLQYYELVFADFFHRLGADIEHALLAEPKRYRAAFWEQYNEQLLSAESAWEALSLYAAELERAMAAIISQHSVYYWLHLYRRIGVKLHSGHEQKIDATTVGLVRLVVEAAFLRFGQLPSELEDIRFAPTLSPEEVMGGIWIDLYRKHLKPTAVEFLIRSLVASPQWVLARFSEADFVNVFRVEGLAYEYWLTTARMRATGKGSTIQVSGANPISIRSPELEWLMRSYDSRSSNQPFQASAIGVGFGAAQRPSKPAALFAQYNINQLSIKNHQLRESWSKLVPDLVTNFIYTYVDIDSFLTNHSFADDDFRAARGFRLRSLCVYLVAIVWLEFAQIKGSVRERLIASMQLYQRAYTTTPVGSYFQVLHDAARLLYKEWFGAAAPSIDEDADAIIEYLTLRPEKQPTVSLWSRGPRFAFIPIGNTIMIDINEFVIVLRNAFFRVKHDQASKGPAFESHFRERATAAGLDVLPERHLRNEHGEREVDAAIRVRNTLFLCECKAMELPLDFDIGRPKTVSTRRQHLESYVRQACSVESFICATPAGRNYDFSWAEQIVSFVVSPFVEWLWSRDKTLWLTDTIPRILSVGEAISFMKASNH